jgi:hypothetical protein
MKRRDFVSVGQPQAAGRLQVVDHLLGAVTMLADDNMHVIGHDRAGVARVAMLSD